MDGGVVVESIPASGKQFLYRFGALPDQDHRSILRCVDLLFMVNAERVTDGGVQVAWLDGSLGRFHCVLVRGPDDLSAADATAGDQAAETARMVVTARVVVDAWCAPELAKHQHEG